MALHDVSSRAPDPFYPGYEIGYDQITSPVTIASSTEATGTTIIACGAHIFDGGPVICTFSAPYIVCSTGTAGDIQRISLFEGATQIGRLTEVEQPTTGSSALAPCCVQLRFTPTAGSHTYTVTGMFVGNTGQLGAGVGGTAAFVPAFIRFQKV